MLRSKAASVRFAEVTNTASSSATTAFAWSTPFGSVELERARVVEHARAGARPASPCFQNRSANLRTSCSRGCRVAPLALDVQQQRDLQARRRVHALAPGPRTPSARRSRRRCWPRSSARRRPSSSSYTRRVSRAWSPGTSGPDQTRSGRGDPRDSPGRRIAGRSPRAGPSMPRARSSLERVSDAVDRRSASRALTATRRRRVRRREQPGLERPRPAARAGAAGRSSSGSIIGPAVKNAASGDAEHRHDERAVEVVVAHLARGLGDQRAAVAGGAVEPAPLHALARARAGRRSGSFEQSAPSRSACARWSSMCRACWTRPPSVPSASGLAV